MGAAGCRGAFGVTLQFALALSARGFCTARRELNLAHRRRRAPRLLVAVSEISQTRTTAHAQMILGGLSPRSPRSAVSEGRSRAHWAAGGRRLMGAAGGRGAFGVTLQFALARSARGFCATRRELNLARRRTRAPRLLGAVSEIPRRLVHRSDALRFARVLVLLSGLRAH